MLTTTRRHLYRDRRRLALGWMLLAASAALADATLPVLVAGVRTEFVIVLFLLPGIPLVTIFAPRQRHWIEVVLLGTFVHLVLGHLLPGSLYDHRGPWGYTPLAFFTYGVTIATVGIGIYGRWSDRFAPRRALPARAFACSGLDARRLWFGLVPTPGHADRNPDPEVVSVEYADAARRIVRLITWQPGRAPGEVLLHVAAITPMKHVRLRMEVVSGLKDEGGDGMTEFALEDRGSCRALTVTHLLDRPLPRRMLRGWLDDTLGRMMDTRLAAIEAAAAGKGAAKARLALGNWFDEPRDVIEGRPDRLGAYRTAYGRRATDGEQAAAESIRAA